MNNQTQPKNQDITNKYLALKENEERLIKALDEQRQKVSDKFPFWTTLSATFGVVMVLYGFEKIIDQVDFFVNNPWVLLVGGIVLLAMTGSLYKKL